MLSLLGRASGLLIGAVAGLLVWWVFWYPLTWLGLFEHPWHFEDGTLVLDDIFGSASKVITLLVVPIIGATSFARFAGEWLEEVRIGRQGVASGRDREGAIWSAAPGHSSDVLIPALNGPGRLSLFGDGTARFDLAGSSVDLGAISDEMDWQVADAAARAHHPGLDPNRRTLLLRIASSEIAVQPDDFAAWWQWLHDHGVEIKDRQADRENLVALLGDLGPDEAIVVTTDASIKVRGGWEPGRVHVTTNHLIWENADGVRALPLWALEMRSAETSVYDVTVSMDRHVSDHGVGITFIRFKVPGRSSHQEFLQVRHALEKSVYVIPPDDWLDEGEEIVYGKCGDGWTFLPLRYATALVADIRALSKVTNEAELRALRTRALDVPGLTRGDQPDPARPFDGRGEIDSWPRPYASAAAFDIWGTTEPEDYDGDEDRVEGFEFDELAEDEWHLIVRDANLNTAIAHLQNEGYVVRQVQDVIDQLESAVHPTQ